jgi:hypothetical protein
MKRNDEGIVERLLAPAIARFFTYLNRREAELPSVSRSLQPSQYRRDAELESTRNRWRNAPELLRPTAIQLRHELDKEGKLISPILRKTLSSCHLLAHAQ